VPALGRDVVLGIACWGIGAIILFTIGTSLYAALVKSWPYNLSLGLDNFNFRNTGGGGYAAFTNSIKMSVLTAIAGTLITFFTAYLLEKSRGYKGLRQGTYFLAMVPLALPGLVVGLAYIFFFNKPALPIFPGVTVPNPFSNLYGTLALLVICNIAHFFTVAFLTASTALKQLDAAFEDASEAMGVPFWQTLCRVTLPICLPAALEIALFFFVNSMATVSALIFLYSADLPLAAVAVVNMDDAGDTAPAAAMCILIVAISLVARGLFGLLTRQLKRRTSVWRGGG
jgi:iron(III) transport system permease protein